MGVQSTVVHLHRRVPHDALERLNRITGLHFSNWPESLVSQAHRAVLADADVELARTPLRAVR